jgi:hypothetical protein
MIRICAIVFFLAAVFSSICSFSQEPVEGPNVFGDLSYARTRAIFESRRLAYQELAEQSSRFKAPDIAIALEYPSYLITIARITAVQPFNGDSIHGTRISFHVEQALRRTSDVTDFAVLSRWTPNPPAKEFLTDDDVNFHPTVLDSTEPKEGRLYILGYTLDYGNGKNGEPVFVPSAIDLQDPNQGRLIDDMKQFLAMELAAATSGFEPYLQALESPIPWVRDIIVHRLSMSDGCNASPVCAQRFSTIVSRQLQSKIPNERLEASDWLVWIASVSRSGSGYKPGSDGLPILPDSAIRRLLTSAIDDANLFIGDQAFDRREMFYFDREGKPGACIQLVPALRRSAHWLPGEHDYSGRNELLPVDFPLVSSTSCIPVAKAQGK